MTATTHREVLGTDAIRPRPVTSTTCPDCPKISVVIPVFDNPDGLACCLASLARQTLPREHFEVIVVDNGSGSPVAPAMSTDLSVLVCYEPRPSSYIARNRGLEVSRGGVLAFTDSDCEANPSWLEEGLKALTAEPGVGVVGGNVQFRFADPLRPTAVELYDSATHMRQGETIARQGFAATANLFVQRRVFDTVGPFAERLKSGGDREWGERAAAHGYLPGYADTAVVYHPARRSLTALIAKTRRVKGGLFVLNQNDARLWARTTQLLSDFTPPVGRLRAVLADRSLSTLERRLRVAAVLLVVKYAAAFEGVRLLLGREPRR